MTVDTTTNRWEHVGNGVTVDFAYTNLIFASSDLQVYLDGVLQAAGYTVSGIDDPDGGNVTFGVAPASGVVVLILRVVPDTQPLSFINNQATDAELFGKGLDRSVVQVQQVSAELPRMLRLGPAETGAPDMTLPALALLAGNGLGFDIAGAPIPLAPPAGTTNLSTFGAGLVLTVDEAAARDYLDAMSPGYKATPQDPATMIVAIAAGSFLNMAPLERVVNAAQVTPAFVAPAVDPRNDIICLDRQTGLVVVVAGAEAPVPVDPTIPAAKRPVSRVRMLTSTVSITAAEIDDYRELELMGVGTVAGRDFGLGNGNVPLMDAVGYPAADGSQITNLIPDASKAPPKISNGTDADHDINILAGYCRAEDAVALITNGALTLAIDSAGNGGRLDSETLDADTCYHVLIGRETSGSTIVGGFKKTIAKPAAWDYYRRIGSVWTDVSSNIIPFHQVGDEFFWKSRIQDVNTTTPSLAGVAAALSVPLGIPVIALLNVSTNVGTPSAYMLVTAVDGDNEAPSDANFDVGSDGDSTRQVTEIKRPTNTSGEIRYRSSDASVTFFRIKTLGWIDRRGRDA